MYVPSSLPKDRLTMLILTLIMVSRLFEDCLTDCLLNLKEEVFVIVSGDMNSRTANIAQDVMFEEGIDFSQLHMSQSIDNNSLRTQHLMIMAWRYLTCAFL